MLADLFGDDLVFIHITGHVTTKADWIGQLRRRVFVYNKIEQKEAPVKVHGGSDDQEYC